MKTGIGKTKAGEAARGIIYLTTIMLWWMRLELRNHANTELSELGLERLAFTKRMYGHVVTGGHTGGTRAYQRVIEQQAIPHQSSAG